VKIAVVLFNLGGPDSPDAVEPFLRNLFTDPAIISLPGIVRKPLGRLIARRRAPVAREIYAKIGGRSPIVEETQAQARALEQALAEQGHDAKAFIAMRCWHPFSDGAALAVKQWGAEKIVLLPLYPQYSTTTTASSLKDWDRAARKAGLTIPMRRASSRRRPSRSGKSGRRRSRIRDIAFFCRHTDCRSVSWPRAIPTSGRSSERPPPLWRSSG
jgi:ferrochelatase